MPKLIDLTDRVFERLTVLSRAPSKGRRTAWNCVCKCGNSKVSCSQELLTGDCGSCGCLQRDRTSAASKTHGLSHKCREYNSWQNMLRRCKTSTHPDYPCYGGRGISVCERWDSPAGFINFLSDMGRSPGRGYSVDRLNVNGNYEPGNVRWATQKQQMQNVRKNVRVTVGERTEVLSEWIRELGLHSASIYYRMRHGMSPLEAITRKSHKGKPLRSKV